MASKKWDELLENGFGDHFAEIQDCIAPNANEAKVEESLEFFCIYTESDGSQKPVLYKGEVVGVWKSNMMDVECHQEY